MLKNMFYKGLYYAGAKRLSRYAFKEPHCSILAYHRIAPIDVDSFILRDIIVDPEDFEKQIIYIKSNYNIISLHELLESNSQKNLFPAGSIAITFDDGYEDNYRYAFPILRKHDIPATIFVSTAFVGGICNFWWERLRNIAINASKDSLSFRYDDNEYNFTLNGKREKKIFFETVSGLLKQVTSSEADNLLNLLSGLLDVKDDGVYPRALSWADMKEMLEHNIDFGAHTHTHCLLSILGPDGLIEEVSAPKKIIEKNLSKEIFSFAYPYGGNMDFNENTIKAVEGAGYKVALTMVQGPVFKNDSMLSLHRIGIGGNDTAEIFKLKVEGLVSWISGNLKGINGNKNNYGKF